MLSQKDIKDIHYFKDIVSIEQIKKGSESNGK